MKEIIKNIDFNKGDGLIPVVVQDESDGVVLMLGYMNREALEVTINSGKVTFFSRSKNRLWQKGETSGNTLEVRDLKPDCDRDALLVLVRASGPTCHLGERSCFREQSHFDILSRLEEVIATRQQSNDSSSYTCRLLDEGPEKIAQKVGEEAVEVVIAALRENDQRLLNECADLVFHLLVLLRARSVSFSGVRQVLSARDRSAKP